MDVFISVAEDSADVHAASLVRAAATHLPRARFHGLTGPRLRAEGVDTVFDLSAHAAMLTGVFSIIGKAMRAVKAVERSWQARRPDIIVLIDSPELHLRLAAKARRLGIPVLYYVAPQTWASRAYRNQRIARDVTRLACILPFEEEYFRARGVNAAFVGHPLFEALRRETPSGECVAALRSAEGALLALLPGSRKHVIETTLPLQLDVAKRMHGAGHRFRVAVSAVDENRASRIRAITAAAGMACEVVVADNASLLTAADMVLVASGTATLHVAHYRKPMVVMYDAGWLGRLHGLVRGWVIHTPHLSLVNILGGARVVPEFMPAIRDTAAIARVAGDLLADRAWQAQMVGQIDRIIAPLEASDASREVCRLIREIGG